MQRGTRAASSGRSWSVAAAAVASVALSAAANAQSAGGYSAGPGLAPSQLRADGGETTPPSTPNAAQPGTDGGSEYETVVTGFQPSPTFTQDREFTTTRVWVLDPGKVTAEQWWNGFWGASASQVRAGAGAHPDDQFFQTEVEMGVAPHLQVDIYANYEFNQDANGNYQIAPGGHTGLAAELRVALGTYWGQIPGNPTLYFELTTQYYNSPRAEFRLLLGDTFLTPKCLVALNLAFERNIFRDPASGIDYEIKADVGVNYEIVKDVFRFGIEGVVGWDSHGTIDAQGHSLLFPVIAVGPSFLLTEPRKRFKVLAALLHGFADSDQPWLSTLILSTSW